MGCMGAFDVKSFDKGLGEISLKMSAKGVSTPLPTFLQAQDWIELKDAHSPLKEVILTELHWNRANTVDCPYTSIFCINPISVSIRDVIP